MKKVFLFAAVAAMVAFASCKKTETPAVNADSLRQDSIAKAEAAQAELDSIAAVAYADSLAAAEAAAVSTPAKKTATTPAKKVEEPKAQEVAPAPVVEQPKAPSSPAERNAAIAKEKEEAVQSFRNK